MRQQHLQGDPEGRCQDQEDPDGFIHDVTKRFRTIRTPPAKLPTRARATKARSRQMLLAPPIEDRLPARRQWFSGARRQGCLDLTPATQFRLPSSSPFSATCPHLPAAEQIDTVFGSPHLRVRAEGQIIPRTLPRSCSSQKEGGTDFGSSVSHWNFIPCRLLACECCEFGE